MLNKWKVKHSTTVWAAVRFFTFVHNVANCWHFWNTESLLWVTFFNQVLVEEAAQDGGGYIPVGQQDARQHGQLVALRLCEAF